MTHFTTGRARGYNDGDDYYMLVVNSNDEGVIRFCSNSNDEGNFYFGFSPTHGVPGHTPFSTVRAKFTLSLCESISGCRMNMKINGTFPPAAAINLRTRGVGVHGEKINSS